MRHHPTPARVSVGANPTPRPVRGLGGRPMTDQPQAERDWMLDEAHRLVEAIANEDPSRHMAHAAMLLGAMLITQVRLLKEEIQMRFPSLP